LIDLRSSNGYAAGETALLQTALPLTALLLAVSLASGCAPSEHYVRPADPPQTGYVQAPAQVEATIRGTAGQAIPRVSLGEEPPDAWWTLLGSDQVNRLVLLALENNQSIAGAKAHLAAARERIRAARGAWYPQVDASAGVQRTRFGATVLGPLAKDFPIFSAYAAGPEVSYDLDVFGGTKARVAQAAAAAQFESAEFGAVALSVSGNVVIEVLEIATVHTQIRVVTEIVADDEHLLGLIRAAREAGAVSALDVLSAQSQADHDRTLLPPLHQQLSVAQDTLANLIGMAPRDWTPIDVDLDDIGTMEKLPVVLPSELVRRRPDIGAAEAQLHAASAAVGIATAEMYPHFTLTARAGEEGLLGGGPSETAWNLLGGLTAPIFHGGALTAQRRAAEDEYQAAFAAYQQTVLNAFAQVADTLQAIGNDADSLRAQRRALDSASASLALTKQGYAAGNAGYLQVLDAQRLQQQARLGEVLASGQRSVDAVKLLLAAGGRVEIPESKPDAPSSQEHTSYDKRSHAINRN
jgi:NodT family efflux transporter outer membrane factor (OMF) lipoprotein